MCQDQLLKHVKIFSTVEKSVSSLSVEIFKIETFESRFGCVEVLSRMSRLIETSRDCQGKSRLFEGLQV